MATPKEKFLLTELKGKPGHAYPAGGGKYFVPAPETDPGDNLTKYLPVRFPESQLFMDDHLHEIHLINDEEGVSLYGHAAYFVEEGLYQKVRTAFEKEMADTGRGAGRCY